MERKVLMVEIDGAKIRDQGHRTSWAKLRAGIGYVRGKQVKITPASKLLVKDKKDFEKNGAIVGFLETEVEGDETQLRLGKYYLWTVKDPIEGWVSYAVDEEGNVQAKAARVEVTESKGRPRKASVHEEGWWVSVIIVVAWAIYTLTYIIVMSW